MTIAPKGAAADNSAASDLPVEKLTIKVPDDATGVSLTLVKVLSGRFKMGATPEQESKEKDEEPVRWISITNDFYIGETEVTQALWEKVMGENPSLFKNPDNPVENISWLDAVKFVQALSNITGRKFRLPTEAEWEYAWSRTNSYIAGTHGEDICCPEMNSGMFTAIKEQGDVFGVFFGHDHDNDFATTYWDILLAYGRYSGGKTVYNHLGKNGVRVITLREGERALSTYIRLSDGSVIAPADYPESFSAKRKKKK